MTLHSLPALIIFVMAITRVVRNEGSPCPSFCECQDLSTARQEATCKVHRISPSVAFSALNAASTVSLKVMCLDPTKQVQFATNAFRHLSKLESIAFIGCKFGELRKQTFAPHFPSTLTKLAISSSQGLELADGWLAEISAVKHLDLSGNHLSSIPQGRLCGNSLESLNVSANEFTGNFNSLKLSGGSTCLPQLKVFDFSANDLVMLETELKTVMPLLREFHAHSNLLSTMNGKVFQGLTHLQLIDLSRNELGNYLSDGLLQNIPSLRKVNLGVNKLLGIEPNTFQGSLQITHLVLSANFIYHNPLGQLDFLHDLASLEYLDLSGNYLSVLPQDLLVNKANLITLRLLYANIAVIPENIFVKNVPQLTTLNLGGNKLETISNSMLAGLNNLETLVLADNQLTGVSDNAFAHVPKLKNLYLGKNLFDHVPKALIMLATLEKLYMDRNPLVSLTASAFQNANLLLLVLSHCKISMVTSDAFEGLPKLKELDFSSNLLFSIRQYFLPLAALEKLNLAFNLLLRMSFVVVPDLVRSLNLSNNNIKTVENIPFNNLNQLELLDLTANKIKDFSPTKLKTNPNLKVLLSNNPDHTCTCSAFQDGHKWSCSNGGITDQLVQKNFSTFLHKPDIICNYVYDCDSRTCSCCLASTCSCRVKCPTECACAKNYARQKQSARCIVRNAMLDPLPTSLIRLDMSGSHIDTINAHHFNDTVDLLILRLSSSGIAEVKPFAFEELVNLTELYLNNNTLSTIENDVFAGLEKLKLLDLRENNLMMINVTAFQVLVSLEKLFLNDNHLKMIEFTFLSIGMPSLKVALDGNDWTCDCEFGVSLQEHINAKPSKIAAGNLVCGTDSESFVMLGSKIKEVEFSKCQQVKLRAISAYIIIVVAVLLSLIAVFTTLLICRVVYGPKKGARARQKPPARLENRGGRTWMAEDKWSKSAPKSGALMGNGKNKKQPMAGVNGGGMVGNMRNTNQQPMAGVYGGGMVGNMRNTNQQPMAGVYGGGMVGNMRNTNQQPMAGVYGGGMVGNMRNNNQPMLGWYGRIAGGNMPNNFRPKNMRMGLYPRV